MIAHAMKPVTHRLRIDLRPRADLEFRAALERASVAASLAGAELDTPEAAQIVEDELRSDGYPSMEISLFRSVEGIETASLTGWRGGTAVHSSCKEYA